jgi:hypothetical protein
MSVHSCNLHCHTIDPEKLDLMGMEDDPGKWLPFSFHMDIVIACKLTTDDEDNTLSTCTTVFTEQGDAYIIDTPYTEFSALFTAYHNGPTKPEELNF